ncbi:hypothetical protein D5F52_26645 (plasmid) [Brevibacillus laterosporus]|uniref:fibronectin type III domain-containing protein n=1 Tax=Brevibacillus laterosporus TaxID=1465 RepID=UPI000E6CDEE3|nr:S-layer homology domain-containing protein [Brevibacillus laterosporus]AYB41735.1 hypothetical protein D5F52_26645 [Brevibacillus laterosporus]
MRKILNKVITSITVLSMVVVGSSVVSTPFSIESARAAETTIDLSKLDQEKLYGTYRFERMDLYNKFDHQMTRENVYYRDYSIDGQKIYNVQPQVIVNGTVKISNINKYIKEGQSVLKMVVKMKPRGDWKNQDVEKEVSIDIPADYFKKFKATLGDREVKKGDYVTLGGFMWRVMGDNYLLHEGVTYRSGTFLTSPNGVFSPKAPGSIGHYLNNEFLDSFPDEDKTYLENHRWEIRHTKGDLITATKAYIGMPSLQDFKDYPITLGSRATNGNTYNYVIMTPIDPSNGTWTMRVDMRDENIEGLSAQAKFDVKATTYVKPGVKITGDGTKENPFRITGEGGSIETPKNLRVTSTDHYVDIVWDGVPNTTYTLKANGSIIYTGESTTYKYMTNAPNTEYKFTLTASNGKETSDPVEIIGKTLEQQAVSNPNNLKLVSKAKDKLSVSWDKVDNAGSYHLKLNGEVKYNGNQTQVDVQGLKPDTDYSIELVAIGLDGKTESSPSTMNIKTDKDEEIGEVPSKPEKFYASKVQPHSITLRWDQSDGAEEYVLTRDNDLIVYSGKPTIFRDENVDPNQTYKYVLAAKNKYGVSTAVDYEVKTPENIKVQPPASPEVGPTTVSFDFKEVKGAKAYGVDRNPSWSYKPNGDGTYHVSYVNTVTGEKRDLGNLKINSSGEIPFSEDGLQPGKNYHYSVVAYLEDGPNGEKVTTEPIEVVVTTPKESKPDPKPETKPEPKPETKPETKPEPRPETKPEPRPETKPEPKPETKPEPKPETKPEPKPETKPEPKPETKPEPKLEPRPETKPEPKPEPRPEPKPEPRPEPKPEPRPETKPEPKPEPKPETKPETKPEPKPETKPEPKPETRPETKPDEKSIYASKIIPSFGDLEPDFKKNRFKYELVVPYEEKDIKFKVKTGVKKPTIRVAGKKVKENEFSDEIRLDEGKNTIKITIEDKDDNEVMYTIKVLREEKKKANKTSHFNQVNNPRSTVVTLPTRPSVINLGKNQLLGRQAGNTAFDETLELKSGLNQITLTLADSFKINKFKSEGKEIRGYYWNVHSSKWVALATQVSYKEKSVTATLTPVSSAPTWYALFAVKQPGYTDTESHWAINAIDRLTGIGIFEGYDAQKGYKTFKPNNKISRVELAVTIARILGVSTKSEDYTLYNVLEVLSEQEENKVLSQLQGVPSWAKNFVAPLKKSNVIPQHFGNNFNGNSFVTRAEAGVFLSNALKSISFYQFQALNVRSFDDGNTAPSWSIDQIDARIIKGDNKGKLNLNQELTRAELAEMLDRTLKTMGW